MTSSDLSCPKTAVVAMCGGKICVRKEQGGGQQWLEARTRVMFVDMEGRKQMQGVCTLEQIELDA